MRKPCRASQASGYRRLSGRLLASGWPVRAQAVPESSGCAGGAAGGRRTTPGDRISSLKVGPTEAVLSEVWGAFKAIGVFSDEFNYVV